MFNITRIISPYKLHKTSIISIRFSYNVNCPSSPVPDLRSVISCSAVASGGIAEFDFALLQYRAIVNAEPVHLYGPIRNVFLETMACSVDDEQLQR